MQNLHVIEKNPLKASEKLRRVSEYSLYFLGGIAIFYIISQLTFFFHATALLGFIPSYNHPDPQDLPIYIFYSPILSFSITIWFISVIVWVVFSIVIIIVTWKSRYWKPIVLSGIAHLLGFLVLSSPVADWLSL